MGLFVFAARDGELLHADDLYAGDARFTAEGDLCRRSGEDALALRVAASGPSLEGRETPCLLAYVDERYGERVHDGPSGAVYHDAYAGTVTRVSQRGAVELVTNAGAWNVAVAPDGRRIAWAQGTLSEPELFLHDPSAGTRSLGRGAHPTWSPSGRHLLFARPWVDEDRAGRPTYDSDLFVLDASTGELSRLTDTPDIAEMQPAISPRGDAVAFADWSGGVIYLARATGFVGAGGGE